MDGIFLRGSKRRSNNEIVRLIINYISNNSGSIKINEISREIRIGEKTIKKWLDIIKLIRTQCQDFSYSNLEDHQININSDVKTDFETVRILSKKKRKKPELKEFFVEFDSVLSKTKKSIILAETHLITNHPSSFIQRQFNPNLNDLQIELSQVLQKGLSHLKSPEVKEISKDSSSNQQGNLLYDLKKAVKLGINGLEHIENVDHKIQMKKLTGWKAELAEAFKERENRMTTESEHVS